MKAMVLAAGTGTRLRPLTDMTPKPLIDIGGATMLEIVLARLKNAGVAEVIINTHHLAEQITDYLAAKNNFGLRVAISHEPELLDTGGGLKKAGWFFDDGKHFFLHNADILSTTDLNFLLSRHNDTGALATLAVADRPSTRRFIFDGRGRLCGHSAPGATRWAPDKPRDTARTLAFNGIHVISPRIFRLMSETGAFSINDVYLRLAAAGETIAMADCSRFDWLDIGKPDSLEKARALAAQNGIPRQRGGHSRRAH
ncbi:MAG: nucleotidyltransferase family protein [Elusimicrobiaceae bacterium]|nr:nucleotidyltransferase family protein [Elusimicrobiaceae bacterium]